jgi:hypothetical protein
MAEDDLHADVRPIVRRLVLVGALAYLAGAWLLVGGVLAPSVVPGPRVPRWVLSLAGAFLVLVGWLASSYGVRWYRRASWVVRRVAPTVMHVGVEISADSDGSRSLRALLSQARAGATGQPAESISVQWPSWDVATLPEGPAEVFRDPRPGGPIVIRTSRGWLWSAPGAGFRRGRPPG